MNEVANRIKNFIENDFITVVAGDFNFDGNEKNDLTEMLDHKHYIQLITEPTHDQGRQIDHCYIPQNIKDKIQLKIYSPYYTDHDAVCINLNFE